jgi:hypothetical protein
LTLHAGVTAKALTINNLNTVQFRITTLNVREYNAKLLDDWDSAIGMTSITFRHISTSSVAWETFDLINSCQAARSGSVSSGVVTVLDISSSRFEKQLGRMNRESISYCIAI